MIGIKGRAGRTGQSQTGECYVIAHERDMKQVNFYYKFSLFIFFFLATRNVIYLS
jgi:replicative superfamily II helicase